MTRARTAERYSPYIGLFGFNTRARLVLRARHTML
jgi:hypothetical protein